MCFGALKCRDIPGIVHEQNFKVNKSAHSDLATPSLVPTIFQFAGQCVIYSSCYDYSHR